MVFLRFMSDVTRLVQFREDSGDDSSFLLFGVQVLLGCATATQHSSRLSSVY